MKKISPKLQEKLESFGVRVPEDLFIFRVDRDFYRKLTDAEMGELYHWSRAKNHAARINRAQKYGNRQDPDIRRGKIYLADLDPVTGSEQGGVRPVMILQNDASNQRSNTVIVAAITTQKKKDQMITHVCFYDAGENQDNCVLLEQIRSIDKSRIVAYISTADAALMRQVDTALAYSLGL